MYFGKTNAVFLFMHLMTSTHCITIENPVIDLKEKLVLDMHNFPWKRPLFLYAHEKCVSLPSGSVSIVGDPNLFMDWFTITAGELDELLTPLFLEVTDPGGGDVEGDGDGEEEDAEDAEDEDMFNIV